MSPRTRVNGVSSVIAEMEDEKIKAGRKCSECGKTESKLAGGVEKLMACQRCRGVLYCSKACQRAAWKEHKKSCEEFIPFPAFSKDGLRNRDVRSKVIPVADGPRSGEGFDDAGQHFQRQLTMIEVGAAQGDSDALVAKARLLLKLNDFEGALALMLPLAESGHAPSQVQVSPKLSESQYITCVIWQSIST